ncbi:MAG: helix-turn-helix domain-containing protein [Actinobacteria bacterium]|nr:helix-turn-helix domain-containing protein [Actinomycetota bacterium]
METWEINQMPVDEREEAWRELVSTTHLPWSIDLAGDDVPSESREWIRRRHLGDIDLIDCVCGPCSGRRNPSDLRRSPGEYVGVLVLHEGKELLSQAERETVLSAGDVVAWDSVDEARFAVLEPLRKQTLLVPRPRFQQLIPRPELAIARAVEAGPTVDLFTSYLRFLTTVELEPVAAAAAGNAALELLGALLGSVIAPSRSALRDALRVKVKEYIERRLADADLKPRRIAEANALSVRSLYSLFEEEGDTVGAYVRRRRLARAHAELTRPGTGPSVTDVAMRWGFADTAHFSRSFRAQYGASPSEVRSSQK